MVKQDTRRLPRQSLPEGLRQSLQERILSGEFREGEALVQEAIAAEYDVSRIPVREALRQLEACGLVKIESRKGAVVTTIPTEQIAELFDLRSTLECDLLSRAVDRITDRDVSEAQDILDQLEEAYAQNDVASWGALNSAFHERLYAAAQRPQTMLLLRGINLQLERYIRLHLLLTQDFGHARDEHHEILRLTALRQRTEAVAALQAHIAATSRTLLAALRDLRRTARVPA